MAAIFPVEHLRCRILEEISEYLFDIKSSGATEISINTLALDLTRNLTGAELLEFAREVLPLDNYHQVEGFLALEYPLLYTSIQATRLHAASRTLEHFE